MLVKTLILMVVVVPALCAGVDRKPKGILKAPNKKVMRRTASVLEPDDPDEFTLRSDEPGDTVVVRLRQGLVAGINDERPVDVLGSKSKMVLRKFFNVPYAEPPTFMRRFRDPEEKISWDGVWDGTRDRGELVECIQLRHVWGGENRVTGQEDCLYLTVYTSAVRKLSIRTTSQEDLRPVIVYIHGGSFMYGSSQLYDPSDMLRGREMVFVKINYRLGPFGFLSTGNKEVPGNMGLRDQILALQWVQENIEKFGGDPKRVTIAGNFAGGASVHFHLLSEQSKGLFHRAISISGTMLSPWALAENLPGKTKLIARHVGCLHTSSKAMIECLQHRPAGFLADAVRLTLPFLYSPISPWGPIVDKKFTKDPLIPDYPGILMSERNGSSIPWLLGISNVEGLYFGAELLSNKVLVEKIHTDWEDRAAYILDFDDSARLNTKQMIAEVVREKYNIDGGDGFCETARSCKSFCEMIGDRLFVADAEKSSRWMSKSKEAPVYFFIYHALKNEDLSTNDPDKFLEKATLLDDYLNPIQYNQKITEPTLEAWSYIRFMNQHFAEFANSGRISDWPVVKPDEFAYMEIFNGTFSKVQKTEELGRRKFWQQFPFMEFNRYPDPTINPIFVRSSKADKCLEQVVSKPVFKMVSWYMRHSKGMML